MELQGPSKNASSIAAKQDWPPLAENSSEHKHSIGHREDVSILEAYPVVAEKTCGPPNARVFLSQKELCTSKTTAIRNKQKYEKGMSAILQT